MSIAEQALIKQALALPAAAGIELATQLYGSLRVDQSLSPQDLDTPFPCSARKPQEKSPFFWRRSPNPELDRIGDWLLQNLPLIREETINRADSL